LGGKRSANVTSVKRKKKIPSIWRGRDGVDRGEERTQVYVKGGLLLLAVVEEKWRRRPPD